MLPCLALLALAIVVFLARQVRYRRDDLLSNSWISSIPNIWTPKDVDSCAFTITLFETFFLIIASNAFSLALRSYAHPTGSPQEVSEEPMRSLHYLVLTERANRF